MNIRIKALVGGEDRLCEQGMHAQGHRRGIERPGHHVGRDTGAGAGAVVQRQPLLGLRVDGRISQARQRGVTIQRLVPQIDEELRRKTENRSADIAQRHKVT